MIVVHTHTHSAWLLLSLLDLLLCVVCAVVWRQLSVDWREGGREERKRVPSLSVCLSVGSHGFITPNHLPSEGTKPIEKPSGAVLGEEEDLDGLDASR